MRKLSAGGSAHLRGGGVSKRRGGRGLECLCGLVGPIACDRMTECNIDQSIILDLQ